VKVNSAGRGSADAGRNDAGHPATRLTNNPASRSTPEGKAVAGRHTLTAEDPLPSDLRDVLTLIK